MSVSKKDIKQLVSELEEGNYTLYFFVPDFDKPSGGVGLLYDHVRILNELGFKASILHQKKGFEVTWLGDRKEGVPVKYMEDGKLELTMKDFFFVPEGMPQVMSMLQQQQVPCKKIVFCQNWLYILNALQPGQTWQSFGIGDCLSVSEFQTNYIKAIMPGMRCKNVVGSIDPNIFYPPENEEEKLPIVAFYPSRDGGMKSSNVIKTFYLLFPHFKWIQFRQMGGLETEDYAKALRNAVFYAHFDEYSSWGTAPIEAWRSGCLVAGWDGVGGTEYMRPVNLGLKDGDEQRGNTWLAPNGDIVKAALIIGNMIEQWTTGDIDPRIVRNAMIACENYTVEAERDSILQAHNEYRDERIYELTKFIEHMPEETDKTEEVTANE
jgi:hypothetical protein